MGAAGTVAGLAGAGSTPPTPDPLLTAMNRLNRLARSSIGAALDGYEGLIANLGLNYSSEPVARLYARLDGLLATVEGILEAGPPSPYLRRLHSLAGWSAGLLANALYDLDDPAAAGMNSALALEYGRHADDARLIAYVFNRQAMFAESAGRVREALRLTREGLMVAPERASIAARLRCAEATLAARLGHQQEAWVALRELHATYESLPAEEIGEGSFNVSPVFLDRAFGTVNAELGELAVARHHVMVVVAHYSGGTGAAHRPTRLTAAQFDLAHILLGEGRPDEAAAIAGMALDTERVIAPVREWAGRFDAKLTQQYPQLPEARDFREQYRALEAAAKAPAENGEPL